MQIAVIIACKMLQGQGTKKNVTEGLGHLKKSADQVTAIILGIEVWTITYRFDMHLTTSFSAMCIISQSMISTTVLSLLKFTVSFLTVTSITFISNNAWR